LEIASRMVLVLSPIEELTQAISTETTTQSVIIPNILALLRSWEKHNDDQGNLYYEGRNDKIFEI